MKIYKSKSIGPINIAVIKYIKNKGKLVIKNVSENSGTMVLIKSGLIEVSEKKEIYLQSGTTFIEAKIIKEEEEKEIKEKEIKEKEKKELENNKSKNICQFNEQTNTLAQEMEESSSLNANS